MRDKGINTLKLILNKEQNINILEKNIYNICGDNESLYFKILYQCALDIKSGKKLQDILNNIKTHNVCWKHPSLESYLKEEEEQDDFIINPFQVEEGIVECKCGSKRVYSYSKQTRSGDEGITSFHQCLNCKARWKLNT